MLLGIVAWTTSPLLAQEPGAAPSWLAQLSQFAPFIAIGLLFFFLIIRPQQRESRRRDDMLKELKKNDRIWTTGGIFGVVTSVQNDSGEVTIRVDEKNDTKLRVKLSAVATIQSTADGAEEKAEKS